MEAPKVGQMFNGWVIGRIWELDKHWDCEMLKEGEAVGTMRVLK